jgi:hypothetical protein
MESAVQENSLTSDFRSEATPEEKRNRQAVKDCDDRCPVCNHEGEPYVSEELEAE